jgi:hypothetical protein
MYLFPQERYIGLKDSCDLTVLGRIGTQLYE